MADVIQESRTQPVIVDFWAPWCGPCKQLGPILERVVRNAGGKVKLVKVDIDQSPELAQQLRIQSIPMVYAFSQGQPVDGFAGALPESQIKAFVERLTGPLAPAPEEVAIEQAKQLAEAGQLDRAAKVYERLLDAEPDNPGGAGRARALPDRPGPARRRPRAARAGPEGARQPRRGRRRPRRAQPRRGSRRRCPIRRRSAPGCRPTRTITRRAWTSRPPCSCAARSTPRSSIC